MPMTIACVDSRRRATLAGDHSMLMSGQCTIAPLSGKLLHRRSGHCCSGQSLQCNVAARLHTETGKDPLGRQQSNGSPKLTAPQEKKNTERACGDPLPPLPLPLCAGFGSAWDQRQPPPSPQAKPTALDHSAGDGPVKEDCGLPASPPGRLPCPCSPWRAPR
jgi:hypothetical protein